MCTSKPPSTRTTQPRHLLGEWDHQPGRLHAPRPMAARVCTPAARRSAGFTLIELIIFIVVVGAGLAGILSVTNTSVRASADPMVRKQALVLAESVLEEVLQKAFNDPDGSNAGEAVRDDWDNVADYNGANAASFGFAGDLASYAITVVVVDDPVTLGVPARRVTVTISRGPEAITLVGYRTDY